MFYGLCSGRPSNVIFTIHCVKEIIKPNSRNYVALNAIQSAESVVELVQQGGTVALPRRHAVS
jgi:hypothetical protein